MPSYVELLYVGVCIAVVCHTHNYLGRKFRGDSNSGTEVEIMRRRQAQILSAQIQQTSVSQIRLKLFRAILFSTASFDAKIFARSEGCNKRDAEV